MPSFPLAASSFAVGAEVREVKRGRIIEDIKTGGNVRNVLLDSVFLAFMGLQPVLEFSPQLFGLGGVPRNVSTTTQVDLLFLAGVFFNSVGRGSCNVVRDCLTPSSGSPVPAAGLGAAFLANTSSIFFLFLASRRSFFSASLICKVNWVREAPSMLAVFDAVDCSLATSRAAVGWCCEVGWVIWMSLSAISVWILSI